MSKTESESSKSSESHSEKIVEKTTEIEQLKEEKGRMIGNHNIFVILTLLGVTIIIVGSIYFYIKRKKLKE